LKSGSGNRGGDGGSWSAPLADTGSRSNRGRGRAAGGSSRVRSVGKSVGRKAFALLWRAAQQKAKPKARRKSQEPFAIVKRLLPRLNKDERAELRAELDRLE
jgi:hypothetical protein